MLAQVEDAPSKAVDLPDQHAINLALSGGLHQSVQGRAFSLGSRDLLHDFGGLRPSLASDEFAQLPQLQLAILIRR